MSCAAKWRHGHACSLARTTWPLRSMPMGGCCGAAAWAAGSFPATRASRRGSSCGSTSLWAARPASGVDPDVAAWFDGAVGRRVIGGLALGSDRLERAAAAARGRARNGRFVGDPELAAIAGVAAGDLRRVLLALGYRAVIEGGEEF